jgi:hypothetical protein
LALKTELPRIENLGWAQDVAANAVSLQTRVAASRIAARRERIDPVAEASQLHISELRANTPNRLSNISRDDIKPSGTDLNSIYKADSFTDSVNDLNAIQKRTRDVMEKFVHPCQDQINLAFHRSFLKPCPDSSGSNNWNDMAQQSPNMMTWPMKGETRHLGASIVSEERQF